MSTGEYIELMNYGSCWDAIFVFTPLEREEKMEPYFFLNLNCILAESSQFLLLLKKNTKLQTSLHYIVVHRTANLYEFWFVCVVSCALLELKRLLTCINIAGNIAGFMTFWNNARTWSLANLLVSIYSSIECFATTYLRTFRSTHTAGNNYEHTAKLYPA